MRRKLLGQWPIHHWPLWSILVAQAVLTVPWLWRTAPFSDEALYLQAGHAELAHWLHHAPAQDYAGWFSGAPVLYPPIAAAADSAGGLVAARAISLVVMLATTVLVYLIGCRLFGRLAAVLAALVFVVCGLVVHYGAFATFGPLSLFLLVVAAWAAVRIGDGSFGWLPACVLALVTANAAKYATLAWDPVIVGIIVMHGWLAGDAGDHGWRAGGGWRVCGCWRSGGRRAAGRAASVAATVLVIDVGLLLLGGADYARGLAVTTVFRSIHWGPPNSAASVLVRALVLTGPLLLPAVLAVTFSALNRRPLAATLILGLFALAGAIAPFDQARIHQLPSLDENLAYGLPFAALGAGYALSEGRAWLARDRSWGRLAATAGVVALVVGVLIAGRVERIQFRGPGTAVAARVVKAVGNNYRRGTYIVSDGAARMEQYYLPSIPAASWVGMFSPSAQQKARIAGQIDCGKVSVVVLRKSGTGYDRAYDRRLVRLLKLSDRYQVATVAGRAAASTDVWKMERTAASGQGCR